MDRPNRAEIIGCDIADRDRQVELRLHAEDKFDQIERRQSSVDEGIIGRNALDD